MQLFLFFLVLATAFRACLGSSLRTLKITSSICGVIGGPLVGLYIWHPRQKQSDDGVPAYSATAVATPSLLPEVFLNETKKITTLFVEQPESNTDTNKMDTIISVSPDLLHDDIYSNGTNTTVVVSDVIDKDSTHDADVRLLDARSETKTARSKTSKMTTLSFLICFVCSTTVLQLLLTQNITCSVFMRGLSRLLKCIPFQSGKQKTTLDTETALALFREFKKRNSPRNRRSTEAKRLRTLRRLRHVKAQAAYAQAGRDFKEEHERWTAIFKSGVVSLKEKFEEYEQLGKELRSKYEAIGKAEILLESHFADLCMFIVKINDQMQLVDTALPKSSESLAEMRSYVDKIRELLKETASINKGVRQAEQAVITLDSVDSRLQRPAVKDKLIRLKETAESTLKIVYAAESAVAAVSVAECPPTPPTASTKQTLITMSNEQQLAPSIPRRVPEPLEVPAQPLSCASNTLPVSTEELPLPSPLTTNLRQQHDDPKSSDTPKVSREYTEIPLSSSTFTFAQPDNGNDLAARYIESARQQELRIAELEKPLLQQQQDLINLNVGKDYFAQFAESAKHHQFQSCNEFIEPSGPKSQALIEPAKDTASPKQLMTDEEMLTEFEASWDEANQTWTDPVPTLPFDTPSTDQHLSLDTPLADQNLPFDTPLTDQHLPFDTPLTDQYIPDDDWLTSDFGAFDIGSNSAPLLATGVSEQYISDDGWLNSELGAFDVDQVSGPPVSTGMSDQYMSNDDWLKSNEEMQTRELIPAPLPDTGLPDHHTPDGQGLRSVDGLEGEGPNPLKHKLKPVSRLKKAAPSPAGHGNAPSSRTLAPFANITPLSSSAAEITHSPGIAPVMAIDETTGKICLASRLTPTSLDSESKLSDANDDGNDSDDSADDYTSAEGRAEEHERRRLEVLENEFVDYDGKQGNDEGWQSNSDDSDISSTVDFESEDAQWTHNTDPLGTHETDPDLASNSESSHIPKLPVFPKLRKKSCLRPARSPKMEKTVTFSE